MDKRGKKSKISVKYSGIGSTNFFEDDDVNAFKAVLNRVQKRYHLSPEDILNLTKKEIEIPCSVFNSALSPLETNVKYLKENMHLDYSKIAELLGRNRRTIWQAYKNSAKKLPETLDPIETEYSIPVSALKDRLSILEATVVHLKDKFNLSYRQIGELLLRNERTIWTVYNRAMKKYESE